MSRQEDRERFDMNTRLTLLEQDADRIVEVADHIREEMKALSRILIGILVSVSTAAILLAINLAIGSIG